MKKFLGMLAIAGVLVACNDSAEVTTSTDSTATDSTIMTTIPPATTDSVVVVDTSKNATDTLKR